jgi:hypothetical protein
MNVPKIKSPVDVLYSISRRLANTTTSNRMVLTQNSLVLHTNELDALEQDTYKNRTETVLCGSSMCRTNISVSKVMKSMQTELNNGEIVQKLPENDVKSKPLNSGDMPEHDHFDRITPLKDFGQRKYSMSRRTKTKIRQKITAWSRTERPQSAVKFIFITLTLTSPQIGTDKDYAKMLNTFFTYLRKYYGFKNYLYVNEIQTKKTNNIHTHILYDKFLPVRQVNRIWCKILKENGYSFTPVNGVPGTDFSKANPVDIAPIYNISRVSSYVTKYITKNESEFDCLIWNCSGSISRLYTSVKLYQKEVFSSLFSGFHTVLNTKLSNGDMLHIHLLSQYTREQHHHFKINSKVLTGEFTQLDHIAKNKATCNLSRQLQG